MKEFIITIVSIFGFILITMFAIENPKTEIEMSYEYEPTAFEKAREYVPKTKKENRDVSMLYPDGDYVRNITYILCKDEYDRKTVILKTYTETKTYLFVFERSSYVYEFHIQE